MNVTELKMVKMAGFMYILPNNKSIFEMLINIIPDT